MKNGGPTVAAYGNATVSRRAVFLIGGYERNSPAGFFARLAKELSRFRACWSVDANLGSVDEDMAQHVATAHIFYRDAGGTTDTDFTFLNFDDMVGLDGSRPLVVRIGRYLAAFLDYVVSGTIFRFFAANWRFALYFLYPFLGLAGSLIAGYVVSRWLSVTVPGRTLIAALIGLAVAGLLLWRMNRRIFLFHLMDLWSFSREYLRGRRPQMDKRLEAWARLIDERTMAGNYDDVVLVGHSTGGALILDLAHYLAVRIAASGREPAFSILTVGSTALKIGLHPAAREARRRLARLTTYQRIYWAEYQALTDIINFYRCDPLALAGIHHQRPTAFPVIRLVRFRGMLEPRFYRRMKWNVFRVHYQFISANTRRNAYDFLMICCGPLPLRAVANRAIKLEEFNPATRGVM